MLNDFPLAISIIKSHAFKISDCSFYNQSNPSIPSFTKPKDENTLPRTKEIKVGLEIKKKKKEGAVSRIFLNMEDNSLKSPKWTSGFFKMRNFAKVGFLIPGQQAYNKQSENFVGGKKKIS